MFPFDPPENLLSFLIFSGGLKGKIAKKRVDSLYVVRAFLKSFKVSIISASSNCQNTQSSFCVPKLGL